MRVHVHACMCVDACMCVLYLQCLNTIVYMRNSNCSLEGIHIGHRHSVLHSFLDNTIPSCVEVYADVDGMYIFYIMLLN